MLKVEPPRVVGDPDCGSLLPLKASSPAAGKHGVRRSSWQGRPSRSTGHLSDPFNFGPVVGDPDCGSLLPPETSSPAAGKHRRASFTVASPPEPKHWTPPLIQKSLA